MDLAVYFSYITFEPERASPLVLQTAGIEVFIVARIFHYSFMKALKDLPRLRPRNPRLLATLCKHRQT